MDNFTVLDRVWLQGSNEFQQRVPQPDQQRLQDTVQAIQDLPARVYNEFHESLLTIVGTQIIESKRWVNPLATFKRDIQKSQKDIQEIGFDLVKAKGYDPHASYKYDADTVKDYTAMHTKNREDKYEIKTSKMINSKSFLDENGLYSYVQGLLNSVYTSDALDEYTMMKKAMFFYDNAPDSDPIYNVYTPDFLNSPTPEVATKQFIKNVRSMIGKFKFISTHYNRYGVPTHTLPENVGLMITPDVASTVDVNVLASAFNVSYADLNSRIITVDEIPVSGAYALLFDLDWLRFYDNLIQSYSEFNQNDLHTYFWLHHHSTISLSPFMNVVKFSSEPSTELSTVEFTPSTTPYSVTLTGGINATTLDLNGRNVLVSRFDLDMAPQNNKLVSNVPATNYKVIRIVDSAGLVPKQIINTFVNRNGEIKLQDNLEVGDVVQIKCTSFYDQSESVVLDLTVGASSMPAPFKEEVTQEPVQEEVTQEPVQEEVTQEPVQEEVTQEPVQEELLEDDLYLPQTKEEYKEILNDWGIDFSSNATKSELHELYVLHADDEPEEQ